MPNIRLGLLLCLLAVLPPLAPALAETPTSPYLRQHAGDPIAWQPWSAETLERARREGKLVFLSIGYASCHFCHLMGRESFGDAELARILAKSFVCILVDREERPDLDAYFTAMMVALGGRPGWPMTLLLSPDLVPLYGANFMPLHATGGEPGLFDTVAALARDWHDDHAGLLRNIDAIRPQLAQLARNPAPPPAEPPGDPRDSAATAWSQAIDPLYGGFGQEAKFHQPAALSLLLHQAVRRHDAALLGKVTLTLDQMAAGGMRDQLGGAFHRYAVDRFWQVPHFEIELGDNAMMARLYLEAFQATGRQAYATVARGILDDLLARLRLPDGDFATGLAADSGAGEGAYYTWTADEIRRTLPPDQAEAVIALTLDARHRGAGGESRVLRLVAGPAALDQALPVMAEARAELLAARRRRPEPGRDDKVLTAPNALAVSAFALAARVLEDAAYLRVAEDTAGNLLRRPWKQGVLRHGRVGPDVGDDAFVDDAAALIAALLDLYQADFDPNHLDQAERLARSMLTDFAAGPARPLRLTPARHQDAIPGQILLREDELPSGNALALADLRRLALFSGRPDVAAAAAGLAAAVGPFLAESAAEAPGLAVSWDFTPAEAREIVVVGRPEDPARGRLLALAARRLLPGTVLAAQDPAHPAADDRWQMLAPRPMLDNRATVYLCRDYLCDQPLTEPTGMQDLLDR